MSKKEVVYFEFDKPIVCPHCNGHFEPQIEVDPEELGKNLLEMAKQNREDSWDA